MTPKFYSFLWIAFAIVAGLLFVTGFFTMLTLVTFGFIAFGLVWVGMICVLPGTVGHEPSPVKKPTPRKMDTKGFAEPVKAFQSYRSA